MSELAKGGILLPDGTVPGEEMMALVEGEKAFDFGALVSGGLLTATTWTLLRNIIARVSIR